MLRINKNIDYLEGDDLKMLIFALSFKGNGLRRGTTRER